MNEGNKMFSFLFPIFRTTVRGSQPPGCVSEANRNTYYLTDRGRISVARDKQISQNILLNLESAVFQILQKSMARIALSRVLSLCEQSK